MKIGQILILGWCLTLACPWAGSAGDRHELIEFLPSGYVNWTRGLLVVKGVETMRAESSGRPLSDIPPQGQSAVQNLLDSLRYVKLDALRSVADLMAANGGIREKIGRMAANAPVVSQIQLPDGLNETTVQFQLIGGFAQIMLPPTIEQVESIKTMKGAAGGAESDIEDPLKAAAPADPDIYTGLVVDARGIGAKPALVPIIVDEKRQDVYSPAFISREFAVRQGVCGYVRQWREEQPTRAGAKPLLVKGLRAVPERPTDIIISNADASRVRAVSTHLRFLRQCRVVIILD